MRGGPKVLTPTSRLIARRFQTHTCQPLESLIVLNRVGVRFLPYPNVQYMQEVSTVHDFDNDALDLHINS